MIMVAPRHDGSRNMISKAVFFEKRSKKLLTVWAEHFPA
jgi:hypothetical protein